MDGWETIKLPFGMAYFQVRSVGLRVTKKGGVGILKPKMLVSHPPPLVKQKWTGTNYFYAFWYDQILQIRTTVKKSLVTLERSVAWLILDVYTSFIVFSKGNLPTFFWDEFMVNKHVNIPYERQFPYEKWAYSIATVDGWNPAPPGMVLKPYKSWEKLPTSTGAGFQPPTVCQFTRG